MSKRAVLLSILLLLRVLLHGQVVQHDPQSIISDILENIVASSEEDEVDIESLSDDLIYLSENPISINSATRDELERLVFLSDFQITALLDHIEEHGEMVTIYELQFVTGFDYSDVNRLLPFITIGETVRQDRRYPLLKYGRHDMFIRVRSLIETQQGYTDPPEDNPDATRYEGDKLGLYTRYSYRTRSGFQAGFVSEKDPGEEFFYGSNPQGFDYYSAHVQIDEIGPVKTLVVGDFSADFGQGLTLWSSASFGKSPDPMGVRKRARGLRRYSSTNENEFLRGAGATVQIGKFDVTAFGSYKKIDANITDSLIDGEVQFTSQPVSGLHRTPNEISNKRALGEFVTGGNVSFSWKTLRAGVTGSFVNLQGTYDRPDQPYRYFEPPLQNRANVGVDYSLGLGNHLFFGELSTTLNHGSGLVSGGLFRLHPLLTMSMLGRYYERDYSTYYTNALAEGTSPSNETGFLTGFRFLPYRHWQLGGYVDFFKSSWLRFGVNAPSRGRDYLLEAIYSPRSRLNFTVRYKLKQKDKNQTLEGEQMQQVVPYNRQSVRFHLAYNPTRTIHLKSRIEYSWYEEENQPTESGMLVYQDVSYRPSEIPLVLTARLAIFETDSWDTRIYAYENDVLYYFSIPAYYSRGTRAYLLAKYSFGRRMDIWFRIAQTYFADQDQLGSGLAQIDGSTRSDVRFQVRLKF